MIVIRVLIVDDSALMRRYLREILENEGGFEVRTARNGRDALEQIAADRPDVVTLDVNMPEMDGLTCLDRIMTDFPCPVVMVSSLTAAGAEVTLEALELGAVDFIPKPDGTVSLHIGRIRAELLAKLRAAARIRPRRSRGLAQRLRRQREAEVRARPRSAARLDAPGVVLIGVSTGGPRTLEEILPLLPAHFPWPVLVAQHMPGSFTGPFAARLDALCPLEVVEVARTMPLVPGKIYIGRGDADLVVEKVFSRPVVAVAAPEPDYPWQPSVERLVRSAMALFPASQLLGVLLTGMGNDGAAAMAELRRQGGRTVAEAESTAVVFGMPAELIRRGGAERVLPCTEIAAHLCAVLNC